MSILKIVTVADDNPVLRRKAPKVGKVDDSIRRLMDDMMETMVALSLIHISMEIGRAHV